MRLHLRIPLGCWFWLLNCNCKCCFSSLLLCESEGQQQKPGTGTFQVDFFPKEKAYSSYQTLSFSLLLHSLPNRKEHLVCLLLHVCDSGKFCKTLLGILFHWWGRALDKRSFMPCFIVSLAGLCSFVCPLSIGCATFQSKIQS